MWTIEDNTKTGAGYISILRDGVRVCDAFPYSQPHTKERERFVREWAARIVHAMNEVESVPTVAKTLGARA